MHAGEISAVTARVAGQHRAAQDGGVSPDEEISKDVALLAATAPIKLVREDAG